jgi:hypothetical protein
LALRVTATLQANGWKVATCCNKETDQTPKRVLMLDELNTALLPTLSSVNWEKLKSLFALDKRVLWVTSGSQLPVSSPDRAMINGLGRTICAEDPTVQLTTLDVSGSSIETTVESIEAVLAQLGRCYGRFRK